VRASARPHDFIALINAAIFDRGKIGKSIRDGIRKDDVIAVAHRPAGIDDVRNVSFAFGRIGRSNGSRKRPMTFEDLFLVE